VDGVHAELARIRGLILVAMEVMVEPEGQMYLAVESLRLAERRCAQLSEAVREVPASGVSS
jgi:hypothetical protein